MRRYVVRLSPDRGLDHAFETLGAALVYAEMLLDSATEIEIYDGAAARVIWRSAPPLAARS